MCSRIRSMMSPARSVSPTTQLSASLTSVKCALEGLRVAQDGVGDHGARVAIAPETVKSHMKHIFTTLSVEKRALAVLRAQSLLHAAQCAVAAASTNSAVKSANR